MTRNVRPRNLFPRLHRWEFPWLPNVIQQHTLTIEDHFNEWIVVIIDILPLLRHILPTHHDVPREYHQVAFTIHHEHTGDVYVTKLREVLDHLISTKTSITTIPHYRLIHYRSNDWAFGHQSMRTIHEEADHFRPIPAGTWGIILDHLPFNPADALHIRLLPDELRVMYLVVDFQAPGEIVEQRQIRQRRRWRFRRTDLPPHFR